VTYHTVTESITDASDWQKYTVKEIWLPVMQLDGCHLGLQLVDLVRVTVCHRQRKAIYSINHMYKQIWDKHCHENLQLTNATCFKLLWICCTTDPQQIKQMECELKKFSSPTYSRTDQWMWVQDFMLQLLQYTHGDS